MASIQRPISRRLHMNHPMYPKIRIPATRLLGIGLHQAVPAKVLRKGDIVVLDYQKAYKVDRFSEIPDGRKRIHLINGYKETTSRIVSPDTHVAVSWGTFNKRWPLSKSGVNTMTGKKSKPTKQRIDLSTPIKTGVSFGGRIDLTKQGGKKKKVDLNRY